MLPNRSIPSAVVIPVLAYPDVDQVTDWLCTAFGFTVRLRIGSHRVQLNVGAGAVIVGEYRGDDTDATIHSGHLVLVRVEDVDAHCRQAREHGAQILKEPTTYPYGERQYNTADPWGHHWTFSQSVLDTDPADWGGTPVQLQPF